MNEKQEIKKYEEFLKENFNKNTIEFEMFNVKNHKIAFKKSYVKALNNVFIKLFS